MYGSYVISGSAWAVVKSLQDIAEYFGIDESTVVGRLVPIVANGDVEANNVTVSCSLDGDGLSVRANTPGTYRANVYIIMP